MKFALPILLSLLTASGALAQADSAAVTGTVKDRHGAPIGGVSVAAVRRDSGARFEAVSSDFGTFRIGGLAPGNYRVQAEGQGSRLDFNLEIIQAGQVIDVGSLVLAVALNDVPASPAPSSPAPQPVEPLAQEITVTARRVEESAQSVPIALSVFSGQAIEESGAFNVVRLKEMVPSLQFYTSNPRNSAINIRGLGSPFGLTNDGIEPGVGFYVDGVFFARPAAATLDFIDIERIEVLRGPQGTLFGKNTTAGAINITTRRPTFTPETNVELSFGNVGYIQAKASISGPLGRKLAGRLSFSGTQRDGMLLNTRTQDPVNDLNNQGLRGQLLYVPTDKLTILATVDYTRQRPNGYAQVVAGVAPTLRPLNRQWAAIANDLRYAPPSYNAFHRQIDTDTPWRSTQDMGGAAVTLDWNRGPGTLTAITAWRYWDWQPSNDRDFVGLPITTVSAAPSRQHQWTQEVRYAATVNSRVNFVAGAFLFGQNLKPSPFHKQEQGSAAARYLLAPSTLANTPGLLDGYGQHIKFNFDTFSASGFGQVEINLTRRWRLTPGLRFNYDKKDLDYDQQVYGGLQTTDAALIALQRSVLAPLKYQAHVADNNVSGQVTLAYQVSEGINAYATYATGFKSVGLNLGGVPTDAAGLPIASAAIVRPEDVRNVEIGIKTSPFAGVTANFAAFNTGTKDFQTQVVNAQVGVLRGYLANAEKVRVRGIEFDGTAKIGENLSLYAAASFSDGRYISFRDAPPPLEDTGGPQFKDISGSILPGISKWAGSFGGEWTKPATVMGRTGQFFIGADASFRSNFSSSPSYSKYLVANGYALLNPRAGFRSSEKWSITLWARNLTGSNYFELMSAAPGNSGLYVGLPGDRRTFGLTLRKTFSEKTSPIRSGKPSQAGVNQTIDSPAKTESPVKTQAF